mmetsp:Transcript_10554/g.27127  ORF Transcript_10554/g.27127 Transcript_10554/m.27127 type:complete len:206 (+) Transcript_10554:244-861(+)
MTSPVSSVHESPSSADRHTEVPRARRPTALPSNPLSTSVSPLHEIDPSKVAPYLKSGPAASSSCHVSPPSWVRRGTAPERSMNIVFESLISSLENDPVSPVPLLQSDHVLPLSVLSRRQSRVSPKSESGSVGLQASHPAWKSVGRGAHVQFSPKSSEVISQLTVPSAGTRTPAVYPGPLLYGFMSSISSSWSPSSGSFPSAASGR